LLNHFVEAGAVLMPGAMMAETQLEHSEVA
jgi:hypothetical protein